MTMLKIAMLGAGIAIAIASGAQAKDQTSGNGWTSEWRQDAGGVRAPGRDHPAVPPRHLGNGVFL